ncbi:MAG: PAS domain-containing protein, partial [Acetobacteraceae bacterium]
MPEGPLERIFVDFVYQPITDAAGKVTGVFVEGFENTDRVEAEAALRESEARYRSLFNAIDEGFCVVEALSVADGEPSDWRYIAANPALKVQSGIKNVVGHTIRGVIPNEAQSWIDTFDEILRTGEPLRFERGLVSQGRVLDLYAFRLEDETRRRVGVIFRDITTRKRAEQALRTSGERFRALVNASSDAVYRMSADWTEMRQLAGREFIADTPDPSDNWLEKYVPPDDQPHVMAAISEAIRIKSTFELEHRVRRIDGSLGWTFSRAIPLLDGQGNIVEWFGTASDITEQKRAEALRTAQNRILEMAIQDTPLGEALDELMRTVEAQSSAGMLGSILLLDDDGAHLRHGAAPSLPDGYTKAIDGTVIGPSVGSCGTAAFRKTPVYVSDIGTDPLWFGYRDLALSYDLRACWSTPILSGCGEVLGTFAMYYREPRGPPKADLELVDFVLRSASLAIEHKRAMHALHRMNETLEQRVSDALAERKLWADISESTDATICVLSAEFRFLAVNKAYMDAFESAYGVRPRVGNGLLALLAGQPHRQAAVKAVWKRALSGEAFTVVEELGDEGGPRPTYEVAYDALSDGNGRMIGAFQYGRDITERLRNQAELAATAERLRQAQRLEALGQLAGGIAHDFNNVIQAARAGAALIARRPDEAERVQSLARSIIEATERAAAVTRRLLTFSRRGDLRAEPVGADSLL